MSDQYEPPAFEEIQGNIWPGFNKPFQAFIFLRFACGAEGAKAARAWLTSIKPRVTRASDVMAFKDARSLVEDRLPGRSADVIRSVWLNVAFSYRGIATLLGVETSDASIKIFPVDFRAGMANRSLRLGESNSQKRNWLVGVPEDEAEADAILILGADRQSDLTSETRRQRRLQTKHDLKELHITSCAMLQDGREHFGFRDGVTQIRLDDQTPNGATTHDGSSDRKAWDSPDKDGDRVPSGEFILGPGRPRYLGHEQPLTHPDWAKNGSYLVVRRLQQHVDTFRKMIAKEADKLSIYYGRTISPSLLEAQMIGRWQSGAKLGASCPYDPQDPGLGGAAPQDLVTVTVGELNQDGDGYIYPLFSHVRKARPKNLESERPDHRRILRRAVPFVDHVRNQRGLMFVAYQASIEDQFEHVQKDWLNGDRFPEPGTEFTACSELDASTPGVDPLVGTPSGSTTGNHVVIYPGVPMPPSDMPSHEHSATTMSCPWKGVLNRQRVSLQQFVTLQGGGYFFAPSTQGLTTLAGIAQDD